MYLFYDTYGTDSKVDLQRIRVPPRQRNVAFFRKKCVRQGSVGTKKIECCTTDR